MRVTARFDSLTHDEAHDLVGAWQRTRGIPLPTGVPTRPFIEITGGSHMNVELPPITPEHLKAVMREYDTWRSQEHSVAISELLRPIH